MPCPDFNGLNIANFSRHTHIFPAPGGTIVAGTTPASTLRGEATIYKGGPSLSATVSPEVLKIISAQTVPEAFGFSVAGIGDINNDGYADIAIGAPLAGQGVGRSGPAPSYAGKVVIYDGSGLSRAAADEIATIESQLSPGFFGYSVASSGRRHRFCRAKWQESRRHGMKDAPVPSCLLQAQVSPSTRLRSLWTSKSRASADGGVAWRLHAFCIAPGRLFQTNRPTKNPTGFVGASGLPLLAAASGLPRTPACHGRAQVKRI